MTPAPEIAHQRISRSLFRVLDRHVSNRRLGEVFYAPVDVLLSEITVVQPDILFVAEERRAIILSKHVKGAPDLVVEVISPGTVQRDQQTKRRVYARHGVPHYWLVDPRRQKITAYVLTGSEYRQAAVTQADATFSAPPFPDLAIRLAEIWP